MYVVIQDGRQREMVMSSKVVWPSLSNVSSQRFTETGSRRWSGDLGEVVLATDLLQQGSLVLLKKVKISDMNWKRVVAALTKHDSFIHPHMVELLAVYSTPGVVNVVLEYPNEGSLFEYAKNNPCGIVDESLGRWLFQQVVTAVHFCHARRHALGNIRLENVLLKEGEVVPVVKMWGVVYEAATDVDRHRYAQMYEYQFHVGLDMHTS